MKITIKKEIENIYSLFNTTPKLNVKSNLRHTIDKVQTKKQCAVCNRSAADVQSSLVNNSYEDEYRISSLCGSCQDKTFVGPQYLKEVQ